MGFSLILIFIPLLLPHSPFSFLSAVEKGKGMWQKKIMKSAKPWLVWACQWISHIPSVQRRNPLTCRPRSLGTKSFLSFSFPFSLLVHFSCAKQREERERRKKENCSEENERGRAGTKKQKMKPSL